MMGSGGISRYGLLCVFVVPVILLFRPAAPDDGPQRSFTHNAAARQPDYAAQQDAVRQEVTYTSYQSVPTDTLEFDAEAGQVFITVLPDSVSSGSVIEMSNIRVPTTSWRAGRAFFWQIGPDDSGIYHIDFLVRTSASVDTLTIAVNVG